MKKQLRGLSALVIFTMILACFAGCGSTSQPAPAASAPAASAPAASAPAASAPAASAPAAPAKTGPALNGEIKFGVTTGITGSAPLEGASMVNAVKMACDEINEAGGVLGKKLVPVFEDDKFNSEGGLIALQRLTSRNDIVAIIGLQKTAAILAGVKLINIPTLYGASSASLYQEDNPYCFRVYGSDTVLATAGANWALDNFKPKKVWILHGTDDVGNGAGEIFKQVCEAKGVKYLMDSFNIGDRDLTGQIMKAKNAGCDALFVYAMANEGAVLARQLSEYNYKIPVMGGQGLGNATFLQLTDPKYSEGIYAYYGFDMGSQDPKLRNFLDDYKKKFNVDPNSTAAGWYPIVHMLAECIKKAGSTDKEAILKQFWQVKDYKTFTTTLTCDYRRDMVHTTNIVQIVGGKIKVVSTASEPVKFKNGDKN